jgi:hypothetical protein
LNKIGHWAIRLTASETEKAGLHDLPCSGCLVTAVNLEMLQRDDAVFRESWSSTTRQLDLSLSFSKGSVILDI